MENWKKNHPLGRSCVLQCCGLKPGCTCQKIATWYYDLGVSNLKTNLKNGFPSGVIRAKDTLGCPLLTHQQKVITVFLNRSRFGGLGWFRLVHCAAYDTPKNSILRITLSGRFFGQFFRPPKRCSMKFRTFLFFFQPVTPRLARVMADLLPPGPPDPFPEWV